MVELIGNGERSSRVCVAQVSVRCLRVVMFVLEPGNYEQQVSLRSNLNYNSGLLIKFLS